MSSTNAQAAKLPAESWGALAVFLLQECASTPAQKQALERLGAELEAGSLTPAERVRRLRTLLDAIDPANPHASDFGEVAMI